MVGTGIDVVSVGHLRARLGHGTAFAEEVFTQAERRDSAGRPRSEAFLAGCFAAKEAFLKSLGLGIFAGVAMSDVEFEQTGAGKARLNLRHSAAAALDRAGASKVSISVSRTRDYAMALVFVS